MSETRDEIKAAILGVINQAERSLSAYEIYYALANGYDPFLFAECLSLMKGADLLGTAFDGSTTLYHTNNPFVAGTHEPHPHPDLPLEGEGERREAVQPVPCFAEEGQRWAVYHSRQAVLDRATEVVCRDRSATHGEPEQSFAVIADLWSVYLGQQLKPHDVAALMALLKVARIRTSPEHGDNWVDLAGYAACGAEVAGVNVVDE